jgi:CBS domain containing-hemolysin-like protein
MADEVFAGIGYALYAIDAVSRAGHRRCLILLNGLLALAELAIVLRRAQVAPVDARSPALAARWRSPPIGRFLSTVQIGITWSASRRALFPPPRSNAPREWLVHWVCPPVLPRLSALAWLSPSLPTFPW